MVFRFKIATTLSFLVCLTGLLSQPTAVAVIPNSDDPDAYTEKQYRQELLAYNKQTMSGAYLEVGKRDPRWDDLVVELLDAQAAVFTNHEAHNTDVVATTADYKRMREISRQLQDMGCEDPLVLYTSMRQMMPKDEGYLEAARRAYDALMDSRYPTIRKHGAAVWLYQQLEEKEHNEEAVKVLDTITDLYIEVITEDALKANESRHLFHLLTPVLDDLPRPIWKEIAERVNHSDSPNRWLIDVINGNYHIKAAWDERGGGWANEVTPDGWDGFREHLYLAEMFLARAWKAEPSLPEAPTLMIEVAMGRQTGEERLWFERAAKAQFDYYPAYPQYLWSIRPRWGGSHMLMHSFAVECLNTERFDTYVPCMFYDTMEDIAEDAEGYGFWERAGVYEQFLRFFEGRKHEPNPSDGEAWWDSMKAAVAWRVGRYEDAARWIEAAGENLHTRAFTYFDGDAVLAPSEISARLGEHRDLIDQATGLWNQTRYQQVTELLDKALKGMPADDPVRPYLQKQAARAQWTQGQADGGWINLLNRTDLGGWEIDRGTWTVDDQGRITGQSAEEGLVLRCRHTFGYRFEIRGTITFLGEEDVQWHNGGVLLSHWKSGNNRYHRDVLLYRNRDLAVAMRHFYYDQDAYPVELGDTNTFHIQMWDDHVRLSVNDQLVYGNRKMYRELWDEIHPFALGGNCHQEGARIRYDTLEVKPTYARPAWIDGPDQHGNEPQAAD